MKCSAEVYRGSTRVRGVGAYSKCLRPVNDIIDGKPYCHLHAKQVLAEKKADAEWDERIRQRMLKGKA